MTFRKSLLSMLAGAALLAGCATGPYYDYPYERSGYYDHSYDYPPYEYYSYGPGYYVAPPVVSFGLTYSNRPRYWYGPRRWG